MVGSVLVLLLVLLLDVLRWVPAASLVTGVSGSLTRVYAGYPTALVLTGGVAPLEKWPP